MLLTIRYPLGAIAVDIVFSPLNTSDNVRLFHPECVNSHTFGHRLNLLKSHFALLYVVSGLSASFNYIYIQFGRRPQYIVVVK